MNASPEKLGCQAPSSLAGAHFFHMELLLEVRASLLEHDVTASLQLQYKEQSHLSDTENGPFSEVNK